jgi:hypothetical protein
MHAFLREYRVTDSIAYGRDVNCPEPDSAEAKARKREGVRLTTLKRGASTVKLR